ncbi:MAG: transposase [Candidatus Yonathbacteria bacterium]|nr:transposase [Candidatus Yonathbacteria bacterium]
MERKFKFTVDEFYHGYSRGNNKSVIFLSDADRKRFQKLLYVCNSASPVVFRDIQGMPLDKIKKGEALVDIGAYCLMPNHFHLLLRERIDGGISKFLEKLLTAYSMYFNKKYERTGKLFEGRFQATHVDTDEYLKYLFAYIHLNPVKIIDPKWKEDGIQNRMVAKEYLGKYVHSSYQDYFGSARQEGKILEKPAFPEYFAKSQDFEEFINEWIDYSTLKDSRKTNKQNPCKSECCFDDV